VEKTLKIKKRKP